MGRRQTWVAEQYGSIFTYRVGVRKIGVSIIFATAIIAWKAVLYKFL